MIKKLALLIILLAGVILGIAATKPDDFRVQRKATMNATPAKVFAQLNDFHNWGAWSPWEKMDPTMKKSHSGAASGKGAVYEWEGNDSVGKGRMEIKESLIKSSGRALAWRDGRPGARRSEW